MVFAFGLLFQFVNDFRLLRWILYTEFDVIFFAYLTISKYLTAANLRKRDTPKRCKCNSDYLEKNTAKNKFANAARLKFSFKNRPDIQHCFRNYFVKFIQVPMTYIPICTLKLPIFLFLQGRVIPWGEWIRNHLLVYWLLCSGWWMSIASLLKIAARRWWYFWCGKTFLRCRQGWWTGYEGNFGFEFTHFYIQYS